MAHLPPLALSAAARLLDVFRLPTALVLKFMTRNRFPLLSVERAAAREPDAIERGAVTESEDSSPFVVRFDDAPVVVDGPLGGASVVFKDSVDVAGESTSLGMMERAQRAARDAIVVTRVREAGGVIVGKTKMTELGMDGLGASLHGSVMRNPTSPGYFVGGSSTGTAIAVASGAARFGVGGDGMGSVRIPSAFCGLVGLKPGEERLPSAGYRSSAPSLDVPGPMARTAADCALLFQILAGEPPRELSPLSPERVGVIDGLGPELATRSIAHAFERALRELGVSVQRMHVDDARNGTMLATSIATASIARSEYAKEKLTPAGRLNVSLGRSLTEADLAQLGARRVRLREAALRALEITPVIAMPTTAVPAPAVRRALIDGAQDVPLLLAVAAYTPFANVTGLPAISVPCGVDARGRSLGIMFVGAPGSEIELLRIAIAVERTGVGSQPAS